MNEDILNFLNSNNIAVVSVVMPDGSVHAAALHFSNSPDGTYFYFATSKESRKAKALVGGQGVKASVVIGFKEDEMITLQMDGEIQLAGREDLAIAMDTHYSKHPGATRFKDDPNTMYLVFTPKWWRFSKFKEKPPVFIESN